jgi:transposase-like protein
MARSAIQFQKGLSLSQFQRIYGSDAQCEAALEKARWPDGYQCPRCQGHEHGLVYGRRLKRYQCRACSHQGTLTAGTIMQATKLPLTTWFLAFYLIGQAKTVISSLELSRHLGVNYDTAWLLHNKILRAMTEREEGYLLRGKFQMDDAYLGGELPGGRAGRGSENKIPIVAAASLNEAGHPIHARCTAVSGFSSEAISDWAKRHLAPGSHVLSDGLACFRAVTTANGKLPTANCQLPTANTRLSSPAASTPTTCRSSAGSTPCWATSRPASAVPSTPSTLISTPGATWAATASASTVASRWLG